MPSTSAKTWSVSRPSVGEHGKERIAMDETLPLVAGKVSPRGGLDRHDPLPGAPAGKFG